LIKLPDINTIVFLHIKESEGGDSLVNTIVYINSHYKLDNLRLKLRFTWKPNILSIQPNPIHINDFYVFKLKTYKRNFNRTTVYSSSVIFNHEADSLPFSIFSKTLFTGYLDPNLVLNLQYAISSRCMKNFSLIIGPYVDANGRIIVFDIPSNRGKLEGAVLLPHPKTYIPLKVDGILRDEYIPLKVMPEDTARSTVEARVMYYFKDFYVQHPS